MLALAIDFRWRIGLALTIALLLGLVQWRDQATQIPGRDSPSGCVSHCIARLSQSSYALFLVHFSVLMLGNAVFVRWGLAGAGSAGLVLLLTWAACMV